MKRRIKVRGVIVNDIGELFCQQPMVNGQGGRNFWCTPGGELNLGEHILDGLNREMIEETGVAPKIGRLLFIQQFSESDKQSGDKNRELLEFFFHIINWHDYQTINLENTSHGMAEITRCGFINPKTSVILPNYLTKVDLDWLTDITTPVQFIGEL